ncbi:MAG: ribonuclease III [Lachnospiraceae bacterium]|nr:ribonuclease III [Lachnospiraceae bacterium]
MEESIKNADGLLAAIRASFALQEQDKRQYSPLTLAFVGDCIYDLVARTIVVERANTNPNTLHKKKSELVKAQTQAACADALIPELTQEELAVYKRGRNAHSHSSAKNASIGDYRKATGLEALYGYLYLTGQCDRMLELIVKSLKQNGIEI